MIGVNTTFLETRNRTYMKKLIIIIASALCLFSGCCGDPSSQKQTRTDDGAVLYARRFEFDGHRYIEFYRPYYMTYDNYTGYVHDPDCPCHETD